MRVIAGRLGGRTLRAPSGEAVRPTADRVREAVFSSLGPVDGARVLDLFAGSGALGIEALSRGAGTATFVDRAPAAIAAIRGNLTSLALTADVRQMDALDFLRNASRTGHVYDLVFLDPPYDLVSGLAGGLSRALPPLLAPGARVVGESHRDEPLTLPLDRLRERRYGDTLIRIHHAP